jgi:hypothetical protein
VALSDALGRFADDDDGDDDDSEGLLGNAGAVDRGGSSGRGNHDGAPPAAQAFEGRHRGVASPPPSRVAFVEGGDRAVALALLEERANISVTRAASTTRVFSFTQKCVLSAHTLKKRGSNLVPLGMFSIYLPRVVCVAEVVVVVVERLIF